jgi:hypothetical protein
MLVSQLLYTRLLDLGVNCVVIWDVVGEWMPNEMLDEPEENHSGASGCLLGRGIPPWHGIRAASER